MIELNEKASIYAEENVINVLKEAFAKVYADGYRDGYKDCQNEIPVELRSNQTEFVDLGLPSGTLWSGEYEKEKDSLRYAPFDKAKTMMIPTKEQCEELLSYCKWECVRKNGIYVRLTTEESEHYAVIDRKLVWHGGMNLLGKADAWDNLIRVESIQAASELMEMSEEAVESHNSK